MLTVQRIDHLVLTCRDVAATIRFYTEVLGMKEVTFGAGRKALSFGRQKFNLHPLGQAAEGGGGKVAAIAARPTPARPTFASSSPRTQAPSSPISPSAEFPSRKGPSCAPARSAPSNRSMSAIPTAT